MKKILILVSIMMSISLFGISNEEILKNLDYSIKSGISEKTEIKDFSNYYNISVAQTNSYNAYLKIIDSNLGELDTYLNFLTKKKLFLEEIEPLEILSFDNYKTIEKYQMDLFKLIKKQQIDKIINPENDYRKLFIFMIEGKLELDFWQKIMINGGELDKNLYQSSEKRNAFYKETSSYYVNKEIEDIGGLKNYTSLIKERINKIIPLSSSSGGKHVPKDETIPMPDNWSDGDALRYSNYLRDIYKDLQVGDILLVENGNGDEFILGYYDHATMVNKKIQGQNLDDLNPGAKIFISSWAGTHGVTYEKRYIYDYVYKDVVTQNDYDAEYERIRKPHHKVNWGRINTSSINKMLAAVWAESKLHHPYGTSSSCEAPNNNYTCSGLLYCAYQEANVDIDGDNNGAVYPDDIAASSKFESLKMIDYDLIKIKAKFECPETITSHNSQANVFYDFAKWNYNCPAHGTEECQRDYQECVNNNGNVYSTIGYEGECSWESCGHTNEACENPIYWGEFNANGLNEYMINRLYSSALGLADKEIISVCADSLFSKNDFPLVNIGSCIGENITGGTEDQDYVDIMHKNCTQEIIDELCSRNDFWGKLACLSKITECGSYAQIIKEKCPFIYNIRTYGCDVDNTDGLSDLLDEYKNKNCKYISTDSSNYRDCRYLSGDIMDLCPEYITGDYERW